MRIKTDFVTNSSSASYIIALKGVMTYEDVKRELLAQKKDLKAFIEDGLEYTEEADDFELFESEEIKIEHLAELLADHILSYFKYGGLQLGDYKAIATEGDSEGSLFSMWLYSTGFENTENMKIEGF